MKMLPSLRSASLPRLLHACVAAGGLALVLAGMVSTATAADRLETIRQRGALNAGMQYVAPEYAAGRKFRTPEGIEHVLAQDLAQRLQVRAVAVQDDASKGADLLKARKADLLLAVMTANPSLRMATITVPTGYVAAPMAIMRTDTTIKRWEQLKGRSVCVPRGSRHAGLAARYGATEQPYKAPADALLALRIGTCDATIHDAALLEELLKLPEWKKFSARLTPLAGAPLEIVLPASDDKAHAYFQQVAKAWQTGGYLQQQLRLMARNIAFEVYLDQEVPDCH